MRADGVEWRVRTEMSGACSLCCGIIPPGELFRDGRDGEGEVCLSCILTAIQGILPGSPQQVVLEIDPEQPVETPLIRYVLDVDGKPAGTASVDLSLTGTEQYAPALLGTVCALLEARQQYQGTPNPRLYESTAGDGWCTGEPPVDEWLVVWVRHRSGSETWCLGMSCLPEFTPWGSRTTEEEPYDLPEDFRPVWHFPISRDPGKEPCEDLEVLAWKRGPARPRFLEAGEVAS